MHLNGHIWVKKTNVLVTPSRDARHLNKVMEIAVLSWNNLL